jgi:hypothetical protein
MEINAKTLPENGYGVVDLKLSAVLDRSRWKQGNCRGVRAVRTQSGVGCFSKIAGAQRIGRWTVTEVQVPGGL